jgi:hypothetical protein
MVCDGMEWLDVPGNGMRQHVMMEWNVTEFHGLECDGM